MAALHADRTGKLRCKVGHHWLLIGHVIEEKLCIFNKEKGEKL